LTVLEAISGRNGHKEMTESCGCDVRTGSSLRRKVTGGLIVAVLLTAFLSFWLWHSARRAEQDAYWVSHTYEVMAMIEGTLRDVRDTNATANEFVSSGQESLLVPYQAGRSTISRDEDTLRRLMADNLSQQKRMQMFEPQVRAVLEFDETQIAKRRQLGAYPGGGGAREIRRLVVALRATTQDMHAEEMRLLSLRLQGMAADQRLTRFIAIAGLFLEIGLWSLAFLVIIHEIEVSGRATLQLNALNAELEQRVGERTAALQSEIADRRRTQEIAERLAAVVESSGDAIMTKALDGTITAWNLGAEKVFGYSSEEAVGKPIAMLLPPERAEEESGILSRIRRGENVAHYDTVRVRKDGKNIDVSVSISLLRDHTGAIVGASKIARDITVRKAAEREVQALNHNLEARVIERTAELKASNHELEAFSYSVSHDLRVPIRHIRGFAKILVERFCSSLPAEAQEHLHLIEQGASRMGQLVDELLKLARLGRQVLSVEVTGLSSLVKDVVSLLTPEIEGRQVEWKIGELPFVECDPTLTRQVFQNLISNALKYSRPRSPAVIEIGETEKEGEQAIFVKDNGVGFNMKYSDKLFGVFQRLHVAEEFEGTGIGLATVERIIKKHGGRVWVEAELDRGATFYFTLSGAEHPVPEKAAAAAGGSL
jgi:PAS domain S-box-containing protein